MKKVFSLLFIIIMMALTLSACVASRGNWSDCPSHDRNFFRK